MLRLRIVSDHRASLGGNAEKTLQGGRLTVGRGAENGWILPDPDLLLSRQHCVFETAGAQFRVVDTSTNGVFLNGSDRPLGRNVPAVLSAGDRIRIGRFVIEATIDTQAAPSFTEIAGAFPFDRNAGAGPLDGPFGVDAGPSASRPFEHQPLRSEDAPFDVWTASNSGGEPPREGAGHDDWRFGTVDDHSGALNQALSISPVSPPFPPLDDRAPSGLGTIPDDWDDEIFGTPPSAAPAVPVFAVPAASAQPLPAPLPDDWNIDETLPEPAADEAWPAPIPAAAVAGTPADPLPPLPADLPAGLSADLPADLDAAVTPPRPPAVPVPPPTPVRVADAVSDPAPAAAIAAFYEGFGAALPPGGVPDPTAMMRSLGEALRASLGALHASLQARSHFKDEFHLEQTSFRPAGENPLKRCATLDEAVSVLADPRLRGFLPMADAVREAASDVQVHHLAYAAALQTALKQVVAKFDPGALSQRLETRLLDSIVPAARKARYWDQYEALYKDLVVELEEDFDRVVGDAIAREYDRFVRGDGGGDAGGDGRGDGRAGTDGSG
ncbi:type VI secretion system-associated FHA domain protein TagH [Azospirillum sp. TSO35-2]|uniref:type VI secretion system-associated FHA domain protein TagH n=1 Tax=Azospirillum sp. TSO35-2 TaxID=716796 RepID=UPI000D61996C|nr:type VI secretion system-associated FHA domain protein TagH [Azospirillum sp. TSO35-2]PWC34037.1 hypothetical protein TSO352_27295 [Azospirillum sp. TSO35-2]